MKEVFISYSSANTKEATRLLKQLELMDISCWMAPRELIPSATYAGEITEAIKAATFFVVVVSKDSQASEQVLNEIALATHYKKKIISYLLDDTPLSSDFEYYLRARHWIEAGTDPLTSMTKLAHLIRETRNSASETPRSKETLEAERQGTEAIFTFVRVGVVMVTIILWLVALFLLHGLAYGTPLYTAGIILATIIEVLLIILILGPVFGGSGKFAKTIFRELINAFRNR